jgi:hypothetical protein
VRGLRKTYGQVLPVGRGGVMDHVNVILLILVSGVLWTVLSITRS